MNAIWHLITGLHAITDCSQSRPNAMDAPVNPKHPE